MVYNCSKISLHIEYFKEQKNDILALLHKTTQSADTNDVDSIECMEQYAISYIQQIH